MVETILLAFIIAKIKRLKIKRIFKHWSIYPILMCAVAYMYLENMVWHGDYSLVKYTNIFKIIYFFSVFILAIKYDIVNKYVFGLIGLVGMGTLSNIIAIKGNGGKMPCFPSLTYFTGYINKSTFVNLAKKSDFHIMGNFHSHLIPLTDIFDFGYSIMSIGDLLTRLFVFIVIYYSIKQINKNNI